jgi:hypothetical protein
MLGKGHAFKRQENSRILKNVFQHTYLGRNIFGRLYSNAWVPLSRRENSNLIQKFVNS